jgi:hypothetical protein
MSTRTALRDDSPRPGRPPLGAAARAAAGSTLFAGVLGLLAVVSMASWMQAAEPAIPRDRHAWGRFHPGSKKQVRVFTETFDESGSVVSTTTTETTTTLLDVDELGLLLQIEVVVEVAGKRLNGQPQLVSQGFAGDIEGQTVAYRKLGPGTITIDGLQIATEIREVVVNGDGTKRINRFHFCDRVSPYVLKSEVTASDPEGKVAGSATHVEVVALDMPYRLKSEILTASHVKTVHENLAGTTITMEVHCSQVPGGVVARTSKELDKTGRLVRRSTMELIDYHVAQVDEFDSRLGRRGLFRRRMMRDDNR